MHEKYLWFGLQGMRTSNLSELPAKFHSTQVPLYQRQRLKFYPADLKSFRTLLEDLAQFQYFMKKARGSFYSFKLVSSCG